MKQPKYRVFKLSMSLLFFHSTRDSRVYEIRHRWQLIGPVFIYTLGTLLLGFWGMKSYHSLAAIYINLSGGEDRSTFFNDAKYDKRINFLWRNLRDETSRKIDKEAITILIMLIEEQMTSDEFEFLNNTYFLKNELIRKGYREITDSDILDFLDALRIYIEKTT